MKMIRFQNKTQKIEINIEGYAYPYSREYWDMNWLSVEVNIFDEKNNIYTSKNDVCLQTTEILKLKNWFYNILEINTLSQTMDISFMEPSISFKMHQQELSIKLKYTLNPFYEKDYDSEYLSVFSLNKNQILNIIDCLNVFLKKFPEKKEFDKTIKNTKYIQKQEVLKKQEEKRKNARPGTTWSLLDN